MKNLIGRILVYIRNKRIERLQEKIVVLEIKVEIMKDLVRIGYVSCKTDSIKPSCSLALARLRLEKLTSYGIKRSETPQQ